MKTAFTPLSEIERNIRISILAIVVSLISFLFDHFLFHQSAIFVTAGEISAELTFAVLFVKYIFRGQIDDFKPNLFLLLYAICFLISDASFAIQFYFNLHQNEFLSVSSITVPNTFGFLFSSLALGSQLRNYIRRESDGDLTKTSLVALAMVGQFLIIGYLLFGGNFESKYGNLEFNYFNFFRIAAVVMGALTAGIGTFCLCLSENPTLGLLGLGLNLQVMGDWGMRLKEYLQFDQVFGISEYVFFVGILISLGAGFTLNARTNVSSRFKITTQAAGQRLSLFVPILILTIFSVKNYGNDAHIIELLFLYIGIVSIVVYRNSVVGNGYLEAIGSLLNEESSAIKTEHKALPDDFIALKAAINSKVIELSQFKAVAITAQYLAHDIRRPFAILRTGISLIKDAKDVSEVSSIVDMLIPNLNRATAEVESQLANVIDISKPAKLKLEACVLEELVKESLQSVMSSHKGIDVKINTSFKHKQKLFIDLLMSRRAVDNIILNAVQALPAGNASSDNQIWFTSEDIVYEHKNFVVLEIGNSGSYIPDSVQKEIFENFFSVGKDGGSGLGLAIAKKAILEHGGFIDLYSSENPKRVIFKIHFPVK